MKALILAAGKGSRLGELTNELPKPLVDLGDGTCCLGRLLDNIELSGVFSEVLVVTGYQSERIEHFIARRAESIKVQTVYNERYADAGPLLSIDAARHFLNDDFVISNGDNVFAVGGLNILRDIGSDGFGLVSVRRTEYCSDDMKVTQRPDGYIAQVGKDLAIGKNGLASAGMLSVCGQRSRDTFLSALDQLLSPEEKMKTAVWHSLVNQLTVLGERVQPLIVPEQIWGEVDCCLDLEQVSKVREMNL